MSRSAKTQPLPSPALLARCHAAFTSKEGVPSQLQRRVSEALVALGLACEEEVRHKSGYSIDCLVSWRGTQVAVEVDGPSHFVGREPTGATQLKRRQLRRLGMPLLSVPYWEWDAFADSGRPLQERAAYLREALEQVCHENAAQAVGDDVAHTKKPVVVAPCVAIASPPWLLTLRRRAPHTKLPPFATVRSHWLALADEWDPVQKDSAAVGGLFGTQCLWSSPEPAACALCFLKALPANMSRPTCRACFEQRHVYAHYVEKDVPGKRAVCQDV